MIADEEHGDEKGDKVQSSLSLPLFYTLKAISRTLLAEAAFLW
jgi:hypothetical protein